MLRLFKSGRYKRKKNQSDEDYLLPTLQEMEYSLKSEFRDVWYPKVKDSEFGGYLSTFNYRFEPVGPQQKMIVSQARHLWTTSKAVSRYPDVQHFVELANQGYTFLKQKMWDPANGGFFTLVDRAGTVLQPEGSDKTAYGNAFGIFALAAYFKSTGKTEALELAKQTFYWLEKHSHDAEYGGYFNRLDKSGNVMRRTHSTPLGSPIEYKSQNSSIHLLEAFTELYEVWPDRLLKERLEEILEILQSIFLHPSGYLRQHFQPDWTHVSLKNFPVKVIKRQLYIDHISFGHDVETAYLFVEAGKIAGSEKEPERLKKVKQLVDHTLANGWDHKNGGIYYAGYYFKGKKKLSVIRKTKVWWAQAEMLNTLLLMADLFPDNEQEYLEKFKMQWHYIKTRLIDHKYGGWYQSGLDWTRSSKKKHKGNLWHGVYHNYRALAECIDRLKTRLNLEKLRMKT